MAKKKAAGSTKNLRDSQSKRRGVKIFGGERCVSGNIIIRQKGTKFRPGSNVDMGKDFTIFALLDGQVNFYRKKVTKFNGRKYEQVFVEVI